MAAASGQVRMRGTDRITSGGARLGGVGDKNIRKRLSE